MATDFQNHERHMQVNLRKYITFPTHQNLVQREDKPILLLLLPHIPIHKLDTFVVGQL